MLKYSNFPSLLLSIFVFLFFGCENKNKTDHFESGTGVTEITPPVGFPYYELRPGTGIKSPLLAKALVFKQGKTKCALLMCDLSIIPRDLSKVVRDHASKQIDIPFSNISIAATHIHTGPFYDSCFNFSQVC